MKNIIKDKRIEFDMTVKALSEFLGINEETILSWEAGESEPSIPEIIKISKLFKIEIDYLVAQIAKQKNFSEKNHFFIVDDIKEDKKVNHWLKSKKLKIFITVIILSLSLFGILNYTMKISKYNKLIYAHENKDYKTYRPYEIYIGFVELGDFKKSEEFATVYKVAFDTLVDFCYEIYNSEFNSYSDMSLAYNSIVELFDYHRFPEYFLEFEVALPWSGVWRNSDDQLMQYVPYKMIQVDTINRKLRTYIFYNNDRNYFTKDYSIDEISSDGKEMYVYDLSIKLILIENNSSVGIYFGDTYMGAFYWTAE